MCNDVHTQLDDFSCGIFYDVDVNNWVLNSLPNVKSFRTELNVVSVKIWFKIKERKKMQGE